MATLARTISKIMAASQNLSQAVQQIAGSNQNLSQRTPEQASALEEIASTIEEATANIRALNPPKNEKPQARASSAR
mgnify:CR=1 FL=1